MDLQREFCIVIKTRSPSPALHWGATEQRKLTDFNMEDYDLGSFMYEVCKKVKIWSPCPPCHKQKPSSFGLTSPPPCWMFLVSLIPSPLEICVSGFLSKTLTMRSVYCNSYEYNNIERKASRCYLERLSWKSIVPPMSPLQNCNLTSKEVWWWKHCNTLRGGEFRL